MNMEKRANVAVFASGTGSNFQAIMDSPDRKFDVVRLVCDKPKAHVIGKAASFGIQTIVFDTKNYQDKVAYETELLEKLKKARVEWIVLAGYMRVVGKTILEAYEGKIINVHPSLLPSFPGVDAIGQAIEAGVKVSGVTIHYVDEGIDTGEIIAQEAVTVFPNDTKESLQRRVQQVEYNIYPRVLNKLTQQ